MYACRIRTLGFDVENWRIVFTHLLRAEGKQGRAQRKTKKEKNDELASEHRTNKNRI
jgi:hypothetical protein